MIFFYIFAQNVDRGYTFEPSRRGESIEYPQSMFWAKSNYNRYTPANVGKKVTGKKVTEKKSQIWVGKKVTGKKVENIIFFSTFC